MAPMRLSGVVVGHAWPILFLFVWYCTNANNAEWVKNDPYLYINIFPEGSNLAHCDHSRIKNMTNITSLTLNVSNASNITN